MSSYVGSLDQGTSSTRFIVFDHDGNIVASAQSEHEQIFPNAGWVEHDALQIWQRCQEVILAALNSAGLSASELCAIGITNQRETTVMWDSKTGMPLHNAIVWQDMRTADYCAAFSQERQKRVRHLTGLPIAPYFSASKIAWLIKNVPAVSSAIAEGTALCGTIDS